VVASAAAIDDVPLRRSVVRALALTALVLAGYGFAIMPLASGADLAPLMVAARLIARGDVAAIYAHDPATIDIFDEHLWVATADSIGYGDGRYYIYLYPPLWAALLAPLTCVVPFAPVFWIAGAVNIAAIGLTLVITATQWNRLMLRPLPMLFCLIALCVSYPLFKTVLLGQIQPLVVLLVVVSIASGQSGRPRLAGAMLAIAAAIKIVPALIALYWLFNGRRACAAWFAIIGGALAALSLALAGWDAHLGFLRALGDLSVGYAVGLDNQSLVAWLAEASRPAGKVHTIPVYAVPMWMRAVVGLFATSCILALIRSAPQDKAAEALALLSIFLVATIAAPIAWLHYFFALAVPLLILARDGVLRLCAIAIAALLSLPTVLYLFENEVTRASLLTWGGMIASLSVVALSAIYIRQSMRLAPTRVSAQTAAPE
jgi:hypothetical protein